MKKIIISIASLLISLVFFSNLQAQDVSKMSWDKVVEQAKKEGSVTFNVWFLMPRWRLFVKRFEEEYGIKVKIPTSTLDGNLTKMIAEKRQKTGKLDVVGFNMTQIPVVI